MLDFEIMDKALKIAWIKRLTVHDDAPWKIIPEFATTEYGGLSFLIECQYDVKHLSLYNLPPFYHTLLKYWQEYNHNKFTENSDIQNKIIWNNYGWRNGAKFTKFKFVHIQCSIYYSRIYLFAFNNIFLIHENIYSHLRMYSFTFNGLYLFTFTIEILVQHGAIFIPHFLRTPFAHH